jgi:ABC-type Fe3+ transport system permease subunit
LEDSGTGGSTSDDTAGLDDARPEAPGRAGSGPEAAGPERRAPQGLARYARPALIAGAVIAVVCIALLVIIFVLDSFNATVYSVGGKNVQDATDEARAIRDAYSAARFGGWIFLIAGVLLAAAGAVLAYRHRNEGGGDPGDDGGEDVDFEDLAGR